MLGLGIVIGFVMGVIVVLWLDHDSRKNNGY